MMFLDEQAELTLVSQRFETTQREVAAFRLARANRASRPAPSVGAFIDRALVKATQGAVRRQEARLSRTDGCYGNPDPAA